MYPYENPNLTPKERTEDLLSRMSLEEKFGQIQCYSVVHAGGRDIAQAYPHGVGELSNLIASILPDPQAVADMIRRQQETVMSLSEHHIPALCHVETLCGVLAPGASVFPCGIAQGSTWNPELQAEMARLVGRQAHAMGFRQALAPVLDICRDPRFGRIGETYGEDPTLASAMGTAYVKGIQHGNQMLATSKHFIGFMAGEGGIHSARASIPSRELREVYGKSFQAAITEGNLGSVMNSYGTIDGEAVAGSKAVLTNLLREEMGFTGLTVSDYESLSNLVTRQKTAATPADAGQLALEAGMDSECPYENCYGNELLERLRDGTADMTALDRAVSHVLEAKFRLGLFENPFPDTAETIRAVCKDPAGAALSRRVAGESMVLLKNENHALPLDTRGKKIAVIGCHGNSLISLFGGYTYMAMKENTLGVSVTMAGVSTDSDAPSTTKTAPKYPGSIVNVQNEKVEDLVRQCYPAMRTLYEQLKTDCPDSEVRYAYGYPYAGNDESGFPEAMELAAWADVVICTLGGRYGWNGASTTGEEIDRMDIGLPVCQDAFLARVGTLGKPIIGVHFDGRPCSSDSADRNCWAILEAWAPGDHGNSSISNLLTGKENPSGKLPVSVARNAGQIPVYYAHPYNSGYDHSGSAFPGYSDGPHEPRYYFGHGLSYTDFTYSDLKIEQKRLSRNDTLAVSVSIANTGSVEGAETVQLYIKDLIASRVRPVMELQGFCKVTLKPGERKTIRFTLPLSQLAFLDGQMRWKVERGDMQVLVGSSAGDIRLVDGFAILEDFHVAGATRGFCASAEVL